jgi:serine/threonine protein phosphatase PrpC
MITCPQCGAQNGDETKFCDRCGQGLAGASAQTAIAAALPPLAVGTVLRNGLRIVEVIGQTAHENRYRAEWPAADGKVERFQLREQSGPRPEGSADRESPDEIVLEKAVTPAVASPADEDPNGPRAKTAELKLKPAPALASTSGDSGGLATAASEGAPETDSNAPNAKVTNVANVESRSATNGSAIGGSADADGAVTVAGEADSEVEADAAAVGQDSLGEDRLESDDATAFSETSAAPPPAPANDRALASHQLPAPHELAASNDDLGEVFGRVMALSMTLKHPALQRAVEGFADNGRVYLAYRDEPVTPLARRSGGLRMSEAEALAVTIQLCQAVSFVHRRGLRVNDICPESVVWGADGRIKLTGLDYVSNDTELQSEPIFNDGYTAPEIYKARKVDKRADVFSIGALLYTCLTGERLESESWREEAGPIRFYPPHVVSPALEQAVRRALLFDPAARWANVDALKAELVRLSGIIRVRAAALTDVGMVRELNEDSIMAVEFQRDSLIEPAQNFLYVVADGMGGAEAGEMASAIAVGSIRNYVESKLHSDAPYELRQLLQDALEDANRRILDYQAANIESRGMGSTGVSVLIAPPEAVVAWVGDSRAYFCDQNGLRQITKDHSLVQRLIEIGQITAEEARHHEHKNVITRSLGARQSGPAGAESISLRLKRGDRMLLCSDGLTAHVEDQAIGTILRRHSDPYEAARELVVAANAGGGTDNVSAVVIFID